MTHFILELKAQEVMILTASPSGVFRNWVIPDMLSIYVAFFSNKEPEVIMDARDA